MTTEPRQPRRRGESVRRAVLEAAAAELVATGAEHVTIAAIAARAGVHETSIYRRWTTKEALLLDTAQEQTASGVAQPGTGSFRGDLIALTLSLDSFLSSPIGGALLRVAMTASTADGAAAREAFWRDRLTEGELIIGRARSRGEVRSAVSLDLLMQVLTGTVQLRAMFGSRQLDTREAESLVDLLLTGAGEPSSLP